MDRLKINSENSAPPSLFCNPWPEKQFQTLQQLHSSLQHVRPSHMTYVLFAATVCPNEVVWSKKANRSVFCNTLSSLLKLVAQTAGHLCCRVSKSTISTADESNPTTTQNIRFPRWEKLQKGKPLVLVLNKLQSFLLPPNAFSFPSPPLVDNKFSL